MYNTQSENNKTEISGQIVTNLKFSHEVYSEAFYAFDLKVNRLSDSYDIIPIIISERLLDISLLEEGKLVSIEGQFRSYNNYNNNKSRLVLSLFAKNIIFINDISEVVNPNVIYLNGYICKHPVYRTTPFGREITDMLLAVNRAYNKSDYIPCIAWGRNARFCRDLSVGDNVKVWGRIQSRKYQKRYTDDRIEERIAYEISVSRLEIKTEDKKDVTDE